ncbi:MAG: SBBP repeat-containing protein [Paludibaculum sp.]
MCNSSFGSRSAVLAVLVAFWSSELSYGAVQRQGFEPPMVFEENQGQAAGKVRFITRGSGRTILFQPAGMEILGAGARITLTFPGASPSRITGQERLHTVFHYPSHGVKGVQTFASIRYHELYAGIDVLVRYTRGVLEYDFVARQGADLRQAAVRVDGAEKVELDHDGSIRADTVGSWMRQHKPVAFQEDGRGGRVRVAVRYERRSDGCFHLVLGDYDAGRPLVVDPVISFSTLLGPSGEASAASRFAPEPSDWQSYLWWRRFPALAIDTNGYSYIGGTVDAAGLMVDGRPTQRNGKTGMLCKLSPSGDKVEFCSFGWPDLNALRVDGRGQIYVSGTGYLEKLTPDGSDSVWRFPTGSEAPTSDMAVGSDESVVIAVSSPDCRVIRVRADGSGAIYSTTLGNGPDDTLIAVAVDSEGNAYATGSTQSYYFPRTAGPAWTGQEGRRAYVAKLDAGGSLVYSLLVAQSARAPGYPPLFTVGESITVDSTGTAVVTGQTNATDLPVTAGALQTSFGGGDSDGFVLKVKPDGSEVQSLTYLGGRGLDAGTSVSVDAQGQAYLTGQSQCIAFPTKTDGLSPALPLGSVSAFFIDPGDGSYARGGSGMAQQVDVMTVDPVDAKTMYATSGLPGQILMSTDGGMNWKTLATPFEVSADGLVVDPDGGPVLWASAGGRIWRSVDSGANWAEFPALPLTVLKGMKKDPSHPLVRYAYGTSKKSSPLYHSSDGGTTWSARPQYCQRLLCTILDLVLEGPNLYAAHTIGSLYWYVAHSTDEGAGWTVLGILPTTPVTTVRFDPLNPLVVWAAAYGGVWKSENSGASWNKVKALDYKMAAAVEPHPLGGSVTVAVKEFVDHVLKSTDGGASWVERSTGGPVSALLADGTSPGRYVLGGASPFHPYLTKLSADGTDLVYSGCFGGSNDEVPSGLAVDGAGHVYIGGFTASHDFPVTGSAAQTEFGGRSAFFLTRLSEEAPPNIAVQVSPKSATVEPGEWQQFEARVEGGSGGVSWSFRPAGAGAISRSGLYRAPRDSEGGQVTVIATAVEDPRKSAGATVSLTGSASK